MVDRILCIVGLAVTGVLSLLVWTVFLEAQTTIAGLLAALAIFYVFLPHYRQPLGGWSVTS